MIRIDSITAVKEDLVADISETFGIAVCKGPLPSNLRFKQIAAECRIHCRFQVVTSGRVAVEVDAPGGFEESGHLHETDNHPGYVRLHCLGVGFAGGGDDVG